MPSYSWTWVKASVAIWFCSSYFQYFKNINIQEIGSGNPGSSNVLRALGKKYAIIVLVGDLFKGIVPFLIFGGELETLIYASLAVIGHCFPIFYGFKGGKGVATYLGTVIGYIIFLAPDLGFLFWEIALIFGFTGYSKLISP